MGQDVRLYLADRAPVFFKDTWSGALTERPRGYAGMLVLPDAACSGFAAQLRDLSSPQDAPATARAWLKWAIDELGSAFPEVFFVCLGAVLDNLDGRLEECHRAAWGTMHSACGLPGNDSVCAIVREARPSQGFAPWTGQPVRAVRYDDEADDAVFVRLADLLLGVTENALHWIFKNDDRESMALEFLPLLERAMREDPEERAGFSMLFYPRMRTSTASLAGESLPPDAVWRYQDPAIRSLVEPVLFDL